MERAARSQRRAGAHYVRDAYQDVNLDPRGFAP